MVTKDFRYLTEKVMHVPKQMSATCMEGRHYRLVGHDDPKPNFRWNGGRGMIEVSFMAGWDIEFTKYNEQLSISRPNFQVRNIIFGGV
jgi:hypothetical protein